ncbi:MAG TPA: hypothetical protein VER79_01180, partial [Candidatus Limnocylindrales bacterium]|nr:hypothetical protein [Candidatus Limnocylindrales bacterium]
MPPAAVQVLPGFRRIGRLGVVLAVLCLLAPAPQMAAAQAAGSSITGMSQVDLDRDGQPDVTVLTTRLL